MVEKNLDAINCFMYQDTWCHGCVSVAKKDVLHARVLFTEATKCHVTPYHLSWFEYVASYSWSLMIGLNDWFKTVRLGISYIMGKLNYIIVMLYMKLIAI